MYACLNFKQFIDIENNYVNKFKIKSVIIL